MKRVMVLLLAAVMLVGCAKNVDTITDTDQIEQFDPLAVAVEHMVTEPPTQPPTELPTAEELAWERYHQILSGKLDSDYAQLDNIKAMNQMGSGMQAACEALALTTALNHFGYELDSDDIVDDYLVYNNDFVTGYCGNPRRFYDGSGIYPPGILTTIWNFIDENDAKLYPFDTTGLSLEDLYKFVSAGCPVLIWTTYDGYSPRIEQYKEYEGVKYPWYDTEHCVCLFGYHLGDNEVKIADSWTADERWKNADSFGKIYDEVGQFSVVLMDTSKLS